MTNNTMDGIIYTKEPHRIPMGQGSCHVQLSKFPRFSRLSPLLVLCLLLGLLAACGPSDAQTNNNDLADAARQIAADYRSSGDLVAARAGLEQLGAPNVNQLLVLVAEDAISAGETDTADALVELVLALGLSSTTIESHALSRGLLQQQALTEVQPSTQAQLQPQPTATPLPENPTPTPVAATATPVIATATAEPATATPVTDPEVRAQSAMNVRSGPGTNYPVVGALNVGDVSRITGKNPGGDWWQIVLAGGAVGWVYGPLVQTSGDTNAVALAEIPAPPAATATPVPVAVAVVPTNTPAPVPSGVDFRLIERRIWGVEENGGHYSGESVNCGDKQELHVIVLDAAGNRLNGVTVRGVYRNEFHVTGEKGPGLAQYDVNVDGDDIVVARDTDGREVSSDQAKGLTAKTWNISHGDLMQGGYCRDTASCDTFIGIPGCYGHYSWTVTFQRTY